jgi:hypothetical protein
MPQQNGARLERPAHVEPVRPAPAQLRVGAFDGGATLDVQRLGAVAGHERAPLRLGWRVGGLRSQRVDVGVAAARRRQHPGWVPRAVSSSMACSLVQSPSASQLTGRGRVALLDVVMHQVLRDTESITHASATVMGWVV